MSKRIQLSKATAWYTIGNLFTRSIGFLLLPLYSNLINTAEFGNYSLIMSLYTILSVFYYGGLQSALSKYYLEEVNEHKQKEIFSTIFNSTLIIGVIITAVIFLMSEPIAITTTGSGDYADLISLVFAALFFESTTFIIIHLLRTKEIVRKVVGYSSFSAIINLILNIYLVYILRQGIYGIILAQLISAALLFVILLPVLRGNYIKVINLKLFKIIFVFTYPLIIAGLFSASVDVIDRFIIDHFMGKVEVGIYSFSYRIALIMNIFVISLRSAWTPYSIRLYHEGNYTNEFGKSFTKIITVSLLIFLVVSMFIDDLFNIHSNGLYLFNPGYRDGIIIIPVILIAYIFNAIVTYYSLYPYVSGTSIHFLVSDLIAFVINILLNFLLIPQYGIIGAAYATFFSYFGSALYLIFLSGKKLRIEYEPVKIIMIVIISGIVFLISKYFNFFPVDIALFIIAFFFLYKLSDLKIGIFAKN